MGEKSPAYKKHLSDRDATTTTTLMNVAAIVEKADEQVSETQRVGGVRYCVR